MDEPETEKTPEPTVGKPLDRRATSALQQVVSQFRATLLVEANRIAEEDRITEDDVYLAWKHVLGWGPEASADAQAVVSRALRENRFIERVSYGMAITLFLFGLALLTLGALHGDTTTRIGAFVGGSVVELLILVPFRFAINSRKHNIALRMLALILSRVDDPQKIASLLRDTYFAIVLGRPRSN